MISASDPEHYGVPDGTRQVLSAIFHRIGARPHGGRDGDGDPLECRYVPGIDALECLSDLKGIIDRSDQPFHIICLLCQWRCFETHLAPLLLALNLDRQPQACLLALRLLNIALNPVASGSEVLASERLHFQRILKRQLGGLRFMSGLMKMLVRLLQQDRDGGAGDEEMVKAVVFCVRSTVLIPDAPSAKRLGVYGRSEEVLEAVVRSRMFEFFLCVCNQLHQYGFLLAMLVEVFSGILTVAPQDLLEQDDHEPSMQHYHGGQDEGEGVAARPTRHGRFAGSVVVQLSTGKDLLLKASTQFASGIDYDVGKKRAARRRQTDYTSPALHTRLLPHHRELYATCSREFLNSAFNVLIDTAVGYLDRHVDDRQAKSIAHHTSRLIVYSLEFRSVMQLPRSLVSSVLVPSAFILHRYFARWLLDKDWHGCVLGCSFWRHYMQLLCEDPIGFDEAARVVFYELDIIRYPAMVLCRIQGPSLETLRELVLCVHHWLSAFERYCRDRPSILVTKKRLGAGHAAGDSDEEQQAAEREFNFLSSLADFANEAIMDRYVAVLERYQENDPFVNKCVAKFLNRIHDQLGAVDVVHRTRVLLACQHILATADTGQRRSNEELITMLRHVGKAFMARVKADASFVVAGLLGLSCRRSKLRHDPPNEGKGVRVADDCLVLSGCRDKDLCTLLDHAINQKDLGSTLKWLLELLNAHCNVLWAAQEAGHLATDLVISCDTDYRKQALMTMQQLLELLGLQLANSRWTIPASIDLHVLEADIQAIARHTVLDQPKPVLPSNRVVEDGDEDNDEGDGENNDEITDEGDGENNDEITDEGDGENNDEDEAVAEVRQNWERLKQRNQFLQARTGPAHMPLVIDSDDE